MEIYQFTKSLIAFRQANPVFRRAMYFTGEPMEGGIPDVSWHDPSGASPEWAAEESTLAMRLHPGVNDGCMLFFMFNNSDREVVFQLPPGPWSIRLDTGRAAPMDIVLDSAVSVWTGSSMPLLPYSMVVLSAVGARLMIWPAPESKGRPERRHA